MMKKIIYILVLFISLQTLAQEDPLYSQYQFNQLMVNPAYAGVYNRFAAGLITRFQWAGIEGAPRTNTFTAQSALSDGRIGIGAVVLNDRFGVSNNYEIQLAGSYNIKMTDAVLAMGIQGGLIQYGFDFTDVEMDFLDDPELTDGHENFTKPNFGVGFMYVHNNFFVGASVPRILDVSVSDGSTNSERYKKHYYLTTGGALEVNRTPVKVMTMVRSQNGENISVDGTISAFLDQVLWAGVSVRDLKHYGVFGIFDLGERLKVGYSLELPSSSLIYGNYGTHEVSISYNVNLTSRPHLKDRFF